MSARKISSLESDVRLIAQRLDIIETNHLVHLREDIKGLNQKIWVIVILVIAQLFGLVFTLIA
jgi:hypothetical protein|tara:strand:+ start:39 stop:227 length:189 start_codon:yes stop_codon:yes gene_type:complete